MTNVLLFGYGSLIHEKSRNSTARCGKSWAVDLQGYERSWEVRSPERQMTVVGLHQSFDKTVNGVAFEIAEADLEAFDKRESQYQRVEVDCKFMYTYNRSALPSGMKAYVYITKKVEAPNSDFPICYSYIETCLLGCLRYDRLMGQQFVHWTSKWLKPLFEDDSAEGFRPTERQEDMIEELLERMPTDPPVEETEAKTESKAAK